MFSLIRFHNDKFSIVKSQNVKKDSKAKSNCIVKCNGGKYSAFLVRRSDDKTILLDLKKKREEKLSLCKSEIKTCTSKSQQGAVSHAISVTKKQSKLNETELYKDKLENQHLVNATEDTRLLQKATSPANCIKDSEFSKSNCDTVSAPSTSRTEFSCNAQLPNLLSSTISTDTENLTYLSDNSLGQKKNKSKSDGENLTDLSDNGLEQNNNNSSVSSSALFLNNYESSLLSEMPSSSNAKLPNLISSTLSSHSENFIDISSVHGDESSAYVPDISTDVCKADFSDVKNNSVEFIDDPVNVEHIVVPDSSNRSKKHFCIFCKKLQCKLARHLLTKHKNEQEVKRASILPKNCRERLQIFDKLRKEGDYLHNISSTYNSGVLITRRQQKINCENDADSYICCKFCKGYFSKKTIRIHISACSSNAQNKRYNLIEGRRLMKHVHRTANNVVQNVILPVIRDDEVGRIVRYDELIIKYANKLSEKYSSGHQHDMIRSSIRALGRFKIEMRKLDADVKELKDIFKPHLFDKCIQAIRIVAKWDDNMMWFESPSTATSLTSLIKKCAKKQRVELIKEQNKELQKELENFLLLWEEEIPSLINKKALEDQTNLKRVKKIVLPSKEDIKKLYLYLKEKMDKAMKDLSQTFCTSSWTELVQATLIFIQMFNRRRAGEIERLTLENFENKEIITDKIDKDMLKNISKDSIKFAKQFVRISLRGKLGRTVSILLSPICIKAVETILKFKKEAGIKKDNGYIFGRPTTSRIMKPYFRACPLLKKFSEECGAQIPESLRGTTLRKHIATYTSLLNIEDATVDRLANFMGHHKDIHKNIYRMSVPVAEVTCVSKLLMAAVGDENLNENEDVSESEEDSDDEDECSETQKSKDCSSSSTRQRRSTSPFGKTKRIRWDIQEKQAIYSIFGNLESLNKLPSTAECLQAIRQSPALRRRTPQQVKSWIDNQKRCRKIQEKEKSPSSTDVQ